MSESEKPKRRWARFSLATLLFMSLCIGGLLAGYQSGYRRGYSSGAAQRQDETQSVETYSTEVVIWPDLPPDERAKAVDELKDLITSTVASEIWESGMGNQIEEFPPNQSLVITAPGYVHREIHDLFRQIGGLKTGGMTDQLLPTLQLMASQGKAQERPIPLQVPKNSQVAQAWIDKYFDATVQGTSKLWGNPKFRGICTEAGFPQWSLDQRIAAWSRGGGICYLALRYTKDGQTQFVAGWHEKS
jgi:hypothetical protein